MIMRPLGEIQLSKCPPHPIVPMQEQGSGLNQYSKATVFYTSLIRHTYILVQMVEKNLQLAGPPILNETGICLSKYWCQYSHVRIGLSP